MKCKGCGMLIDDNAAVCELCGEAVGRESVSEEVLKNQSEPEINLMEDVSAQYAEPVEPAYHKKSAPKSKKEVHISTNVVIAALAVVIAVAAISVSAIFIAKSVNKADDNAFVNTEAVLEESAEQNEEEKEYGTPVFSKIAVSSTLSDQYDSDYDGANVFDKNSTTAWVEGAEGNGIGESITFVADSEQQVKGIRILNGYCKNEDIYYKNNRVKEVEISFPDGTVVKEQLPDIYNNYYSIAVDNVVCSNFTVKILDIYGGNKYSDTCISEIEIY